MQSLVRRPSSISRRICSRQRSPSEHAISLAQAFVYLEEDLLLEAASLEAWARDTLLLRAAGAEAAGFRCLTKQAPRNRPHETGQGLG